MSFNVGDCVMVKYIGFCRIEKIFKQEDGVSSYMLRRGSDAFFAPESDLSLSPEDVEHESEE